MSLSCHHHKRLSRLCPACRDNKREGLVLSTELQGDIAKLRAQRLTYESALEFIYENYCDSYCWNSAESALEKFGVPLPKMPWDKGAL